METFDCAGYLRRARRRADLSQRELAASAGVSPSTIGRAEVGRPISLEFLVSALAVAGLRLAVVDEIGHEVQPMREVGDAGRNRGGRHFPAHLDTELAGFYRHSNRPWPTDRPEPVVTFRGRGSRVPYPRLSDHRTRAELEADRREQLRQRWEKLRPPQWDRRSAFYPECECPIECTRFCVPTCECQCEPDISLPATK